MFQHYNNKNNETYGLYSLSEEFVNTLDAVFGQHQNAHEVFFDLQITGKKQWKERLEKAGELEATKAISAIHQLTQVHKERAKLTRALAKSEKENSELREGVLIDDASDNSNAATQDAHVLSLNFKTNTN